MFEKTIQSDNNDNNEIKIITSLLSIYNVVY